jgi:hypothetical protein
MILPPPEGGTTIMMRGTRGISPLPEDGTTIMMCRTTMIPPPPEGGTTNCQARITHVEQCLKVINRNIELTKEQKVDIDTIAMIAAIIGLVPQIIIAIIGQSGLLDFFTRADMRYIRTHTLRKDGDFVQGIILANKGGGLAREIVLRVDYDGTVISDLQLEQEVFQIEPSINGGVGHSYVVLHFNRLPPKSNGTVYLSIKSKTKPKISLTYNNHSGKEEDYKYKRSLQDTVTIVIGLFATSWIIFSRIFGL